VLQAPVVVPTVASAKVRSRRRAHRDQHGERECVVSAVTQDRTLSQAAKQPLTSGMPGGLLAAVACYQSDAARQTCPCKEIPMIRCLPGWQASPWKQRLFQCSATCCTCLVHSTLTMLCTLATHSPFCPVRCAGRCRPPCSCCPASTPCCAGGAATRCASRRGRSALCAVPLFRGGLM
jgi:hypothetical protein